MLKKSFSKNNDVCKVTFTLPIEAAKGGKDVRVLGDFNQWSWEKGYKMNANKSEFTAEVELTAGKEFQFRYLIDNHIWENDWKADSYVPAAFGEYNSVVSLVIKKEAAKPVAKTAAATAAKAAPKAATQPTAAKTSAKPAAAKNSAAKTTAKPAPKKAAAPKTVNKTTAKK